MASSDLIETRLSQPMDWAVFEKLVYEVLIGDDLPKLKKIGGGHDEGVDAVVETYYADEREMTTVVQVTSERTQQYKLSRTLKRLAETKNQCRHLVVVFRAPVTSETKRTLQDIGIASQVAVEIRDLSYLVAQLGKPASTIFARIFGTPREQLDVLLAKSDPLRVASDRTKLAMLATLATFVANPRARIARQTLFQRTVLAAIASSQTGLSVDEALEVVRKLIPEETLHKDQVTAALETLQKEGHCRIAGEKFFASDLTIASTAAAISESNSGYENLQSYVFKRCEKAARLDDAAKGREGPSRLDNSRGVLKWNLCGFTLPRNAAASRSKRYRVSARQDGDVADARCRT